MAQDMAKQKLQELNVRLVNVQTERRKVLKRADDLLNEEATIFRDSVELNNDIWRMQNGRL